MQVISYVENNLICSSADSYFDDWIDDGEVCNPSSNPTSL